MSRIIKDICIEINRFITLTPFLYQTFKYYYNKNHTLTVHQIFEILATFQPPPFKANLRSDYRDYMKHERFTEEDMETFFQDTCRIDENQYLKIQKRQLRIKARRVKPLLLKIIPILSFQEYKNSLYFIE